MRGEREKKKREEKNILLGWWCPPLLLLLSLSDDSTVTTVKKINSLYCLRKFLLNMKHAHIPTSFRRAGSQTKRKWDAMYKFQKRLSTLANNVAHLVASKKILHQSAYLFFFLLFFDGYYPQHTLHTQKLWSITPIQCLTCPRNTEGEKKKKCLTAAACFTKLLFFLKLTFFYDCTASYTTKESFQLEKEKKKTKKPPRSLASPSERKGKQSIKRKKKEDAIKQACCKSTEICTDPGNHINKKQHEFPFCCCTSKLRNKAFLLFFFFSSILLCSSHPNVQGAQKRAHELGSFYLPRKTRTKKKKRNTQWSNLMYKK